MTRRSIADPGFLKVEERSADGPPVADAMDRLRADRLDALVIHDVIAPEALARMAAALEANAPGFVRTEFPGPFRSFFYGMNLNLSDPGLEDYFAAEPAFAAALETLAAPGAPAPHARVAETLSRFDQGRAYVAAPGPEAGRRHFFTTLRGHRPGGYIPVHFDNEQADRPTYRHVAPQIESDIFSFVLTLAEAEAGGQLELFNLRADAHSGDFRNVDGGRAEIDLETLERVALPVPAGSMVLVNSGQLLHRVTLVEGARTRWTMCSFMALEKGGARVLCWG
ncbi:MAG: 2OG-Fe(II) oxygenase [Pseudomonadota bacterium]